MFNKISSLFKVLVYTNEQYININVGTYLVPTHITYVIGTIENIFFNVGM